MMRPRSSRIQFFVFAASTAVAVLMMAVSVFGQDRRTIAVTIDDLPVVLKSGDLKQRKRITKKLLSHISKSAIPAVGFVNEGKLFKAGVLSEDEVGLLRSWLDSGLELGNHTYSHLSLHANPLEDYQADILKGGIVTERLLSGRGLNLRYFRHPFLFTGLDLKTKENLSGFLEKNGYTIAPVTIDNSDWIFARAYDNAVISKDKQLKFRIGKAYLPYLEAKIDYWERQSEKIFGRQISQILLLHANSINADYFGDVAEMIRKRGYRFVTLENALADEAYLLPDTFTGRAGISWLHRWALEMGRETLLPDEPGVPEFVMKAAGVESE